MPNNKIILNGCIESFKEENELLNNESEVFELFSLSQITKHLDLSFENITDSIVDGGNDGGIDSMFIIVDDLVPESIEDFDDIKITRKSNVSIIISQCKKENSFKEGALDKLITTFPEIFDLEKSIDALLVRFNSKLVDKAIIAREAWKKCSISGGKLNLIFNYCANAESVVISSTFNSKVEQLKKIAQDHFVGGEIAYSNYSCEELLKLFQTHKDERLQLTFKETPLATSYSTYGIGYVGTAKLGDFKAFLSNEDNSIREEIFESNIRHFQGLVDVNKKIKISIENPNHEDFWWLNNGITIIANNPSLVGTILSIDNVQIVNGLQTSYSIFNNHTGDLEDTRSVLVKVVINENKKVIDNIISSTNSQNPVSPALLRATDDVQRELELFFSNAGYYYDRRKNYYKNQGKPANRIFSIQSTAQSIETILFSKPHSARSKPTSLIKDDTTYNKIFTQKENYLLYLNCSLIAKQVTDLWSTIEDKELKNRLVNFKLHLSRIMVSVLLNKSEIKVKDILEINIATIDNEKFNECCILLDEAIDNYKTQNPDSNLINMAKASGLTELLISKIKTKFSNTSANTPIT